MEKIEYGPVSFNVIRTLRFERSSVEDSVGNYLYTHWDIVVEVNYQPVMAAYVAPALFTNPVALPGTLPGQTDIGTLVHMLQPRQLLRITAGGSVILETPSQITPGGKRFKCDVTGGPHVKVVGVPMMVGTRHWVVTLHITADARDRRQVNPSVERNAVISNVWVCNEDIDFQHRSVRRFAGRAILRADVMRTNTTNANSFRDLYLFRCPNHYKRENVQVQLSEGGTVCDWSFEDVMQGYDLGTGSPILKIECFRTGTVSRKSPAHLIFNAMRSIARTGILNPLNAFVGLFAVGIDNLPVSYRQVRCDIIGDRNANLATLSRIAHGVCFTHIGLQSFTELATGTMEITFRQDIGDQVYTSCEMSSQYTDEAILAAAAQVPDALLAIGRRIATGDLDGLNNWQRIAPRITTNARAIAQQLTAAFCQLDSRNLIYSEPVEEGGRAAEIQRIIDVWLNAPRLMGGQNEQVRQMVVASREGQGLGPQDGKPFAGSILSWGRNDNPPMLQGAFGVVPQNSPGTANIPVQPGQVTVKGGLPVGIAGVGSVPTGIEHLIVQALLGTNFALGQNQTPPEPFELVNDS